MAVAVAVVVAVAVAVEAAVAVAVAAEEEARVDFLPATAPISLLPLLTSLLVLSVSLVNCELFPVPELLSSESLAEYNPLSPLCVSLAPLQI